ncbi:helix-turn-helix domain-containing protein [Kitasatospora sp. NBC_00085]|uniref:helix-turn-helix domain-containing protein n=1 Tax=Kitasatospora sp. NBC_00085 TaxID=2903566 RepID=UPI00386A8175
MILVVKGGQWAGTAVAVVLETEVRERLMRTAASAKSEVRAVLRAQIVLAAADGLANGAIARELEVSVNTVRKWRRRFAGLGVDGLRDAERSGRPKVYGSDVRVAIVASATSATSEPPCPEATWSHRSIAERVAGTCFAPVSAAVEQSSVPSLRYWGMVSRMRPWPPPASTRSWALAMSSSG